MPMTGRDRVKLLFGPSQAPALRTGGGGEDGAGGLRPAEVAAGQEAVAGRGQRTATLWEGGPVLTAAMYVLPGWATLILASLVVLVVLWATRDKRPPGD